jgi:hypothetical protein
VVTKANLFVLGHVNLLPLAVVIRCLRPKLPILLFVHGDEVWNDPRISREKRWFEPWFLRTVTKIASVSSFTAATMAREYHVPLAKFSLLPNAVDPPSWMLTVPTDYSVRDGRDRPQHRSFKMINLLSE